MQNKILLMVCLALSLILRMANAEAGCTTSIYQIHFPVSAGTGDPIDLLIIKDSSNNVVQVSSLPSQVLHKISIICQSKIPSLTVSEVVAKDFLGYFVDLPFYSLQGSLGLGTLQPVYDGDPSERPWLGVLPVTNCMINAAEITNVFFVEVIDRLAQLLELKTGILPSGGLIFGTEGNWVTNYVPTFTMELSVRYQE